MKIDNNFFKEYAKCYDNILLNFDPYIEIINLHFNIHKNTKKILEIGCGTGNLIKRFTNSKIQTYAIDINESMMNLIFDKIQNPKYLKLYKMNAEDLGFKDNAFQEICAMNVIYILKNPKKALKEIFRVLKPGGTFSISGPLPDPDIALLSEKATSIMQKKGMYTTDIKKQIKQMGLINNQLKKSASLIVTKQEIIKILINEVGFSKVIYSTDHLYFNNVYLIAVKK